MTPLSNQLRMTVYSSVMAALIAAGGFISIPIGLVPIVLHNMFMLLAGLLLGAKWGLACVAVYLLAGAVGLPVFAGGNGGISVFYGPTGGYLLAYLPAVLIVGSASGSIGRRFKEKPTIRFFIEIGFLILASLVVYAIGVPWLKMITNMSWKKSIAVGMLPFIIGDGLKLVAAAIIARVLRPIIAVEKDIPAHTISVPN